MRAGALFATPLKQPDRRSCGAAVLVVARMLRDPSYAARVGPHFAAECAAMHRRVTSASDVLGRLQAPWPRALGTPPWAMARQLRWTTGVRYRVERVRPEHRVEALSHALAAVAEGLPVALYVGSRRLPRHVVLLVDTGDGRPTAYEPGCGQLVRFTPQQFVDGTLRLGGWPRPWVLVTPAGFR